MIIDKDKMINEDEIIEDEKITAVQKEGRSTEMPDK